MASDIYHYVLKKIASMCLSAKLLTDIFDESESAFMSKFPNHFHIFMEKVGSNAEKLNYPIKHLFSYETKTTTEKRYLQMDS